MEAIPGPRRKGPGNVQWLAKSFEDLTVSELYAALRLRSEAFVVEQNCVYQDPDDRDQQALHIMGWREDCLAAYCRLLPPGAKDGDWAIGRVVTSRAARGEGLARELMNQAIAFVQRREAPRIRLAAQAHLTKFYAGFGFRAIGAPYDEDGIAHIDMLLEPRIDP